MGVIYEAIFDCQECGQHARHQLRYAGRLLASSRCTNCGYTIWHEQHDLRTTYIHDLEQRLVSKPTRMWRRILRNPVKFAWELPAAVVTKPAKMYAEVKQLFQTGAGPK